MRARYVRVRALCIAFVLLVLLMAISAFLRHDGFSGQNYCRRSALRCAWDDLFQFLEARRKMRTQPGFTANTMHRHDDTVVLAGGFDLVAGDWPGWIWIVFIAPRPDRWRNRKRASPVKSWPNSLRRPSAPKLPNNCATTGKQALPSKPTGQAIWGCQVGRAARRRKATRGSASKPGSRRIRKLI